MWGRFGDWSSKQAVKKLGCLVYIYIYIYATQLYKVLGQYKDPVMNQPV